MNERALSTALDLDGAFNNVIVDIAPGGTCGSSRRNLTASWRPMVASLPTIAPSIVGQAGRRPHPGAARLRHRLSAIFLSIAAFMTSAASCACPPATRTDAQLKAFGYSSRAIGWHYFMFSLSS
jgi:putative ABC transport system permease protein